MNRVMGTIEGHSAAINVGIGFIPSKVQTYVLNDVLEVNWIDLMMRDTNVDVAGGYVASDGIDVATAAASAIKIFRGGNVIGTASEVYKVADPAPDKRATGAGATIATWTLGNATNKTGSWNDVDGTLVAAGSMICIDGKNYYITALTSDGEQANEVTLSESVPSGTITFLSGKFTYIAAVAGIIMPEGFTIATGEINTDSECIVFIAEH